MFGEQYGRTEEKTYAAFASAISMTSEARTIHKGTHFRFTSKSQH